VKEMTNKVSLFTEEGNEVILHVANVPGEVTLYIENPVTKEHKELIRLNDDDVNNFLRGE
jgi:hypothetical protein